MDSHPKIYEVVAVDPETGERDRLGEWHFDEDWSIVEIAGKGEYSEMLDEIADEINGQNELELSTPGPSSTSEKVGRGDPRFFEALQRYVKDEFDLELAGSP